MEAKEYLLEWPPPHSETLPDEQESPPEAKRRKKSHEEGLPVTGKETSRDSDDELIKKDTNVSTKSLLAMWWKRNNRNSENARDKSFQLPESKNPNTLLHHLTLHSSVKQFLQARVHFLQCKTKSVEVLRSLYECHQLLRNEEDALHCIEVAYQMDITNKEIEWQRLLAKRQYEIRQMQEVLLKRLESDSEADLKLPQSIPVERRDAESLSYGCFVKHYAMKHKPVIITGLQLTREHWTLEHLSKTIGEKIAPLRQPVAGSVEWARLESGGECRVWDFIKDIQTSNNAMRYLFDWSLPLNCPELVQELTIPRYFSGDFLQQTPPSTLYRDSWPSLFVAPPNITSFLHIDAFGSNFWMALFEGRKRWIFFPPEDLPCLYPLYTHSLDAVFEVDLKNPDFKRHPLLSLTHPRECLLEPGEVLFVPAGCPHQVDTLGASVAISANYIDSSNFELVKEELEANSLIDERAAELLGFLKQREGYEMKEDQEPLEWNEFKKSVSS